MEVVVAVVIDGTKTEVVVVVVVVSVAVIVTMIVEVTIEMVSEKIIETVIQKSHGVGQRVVVTEDLQSLDMEIEVVEADLVAVNLVVMQEVHLQQLGNLLIYNLDQFQLKMLLPHQLHRR